MKVRSVPTPLFQLGEGSISLINSNVTNNEADIAAGISIQDSTGTIEIQDSQVTNNISAVTKAFNSVNPDIVRFPGITEGFAGIDPDPLASEPLNLTGTPENDVLFGVGGNDTLDGGAGINILNGNFQRGYLGSEETATDSNTFVLSTEAEATIIVNFIDGQDVIGLKGGISFDDLSFSGNVISLNDQPIAFLNQFDTTALTSEDFVTL